MWFSDQRIDTLPERKLMKVRLHFGFLFQMGALFDSDTVENNIAFPLVEHTNKTPAQIKEIVRHKLAMVGLPDVGPKMPADYPAAMQGALAGASHRDGSASHSL